MTQPTPGRFFQTVNAYHQTTAIKAAIELGVFTGIGAGNKTAASLADYCHASVKGMRVLCDYLVVLQFLRKDGERYDLTPEAGTFLDQNSPMYAGGTIGFLLSPQMTAAFDDLAAVVRKGGTIMNPGGTMSYEHPVWKDFARSMAPLVLGAAEEIARAVNANSGSNMKVLDLAAGHGLFGITIAEHNPSASIYAVDWAPVLEIAREYAKAKNVTERWHAMEGSAFEVEFGSGYDVVLITNFHHHFPTSTIEMLMRKVHGALDPGGVVATLDFVPNDDRVTPPDAASFALTMLGTTEEGDAYTFAEYDQMYRNSGFGHSQIQPIEGTPQSLILTRR
jgi:ubiquinone/menaquinone biosynthesis C-methylase UbiE